MSVREIKFRCYDKEEGYMLPWEHLVQAGDLPEMLLHGHEEDESYSKLMGFTGLKDKNGIEIYEGDILKCVGPHSPTVRWYATPNFTYHGDSLVVTPSDAGIQLRVIGDFVTNEGKDFSPNGYRGGTKPPVDFYQLWNFQSSFQVIGNVYENPKLLEVNN